MRAPVVTVKLLAMVDGLYILILKSSWVIICDVRAVMYTLHGEAG